MHGIVFRTQDSQAIRYSRTIITLLPKPVRMLSSNFAADAVGISTHYSCLWNALELFRAENNTMAQTSHWFAFLDISYTDRGVDDDHVPMKHVADTLASSLQRHSA